MRSCGMELTLANSGSWIAICNCGWIGTVHPGARTMVAHSVMADPAREDAKNEWQQHATGQRSHAASSR